MVPPIKLDLNSLASVRRFADCIRSQYQKIDVLALNAGRGGAKGDPRDVTGEGLEAIMTVNALSHAVLALELLPLVANSPAGRIVSQSSGARLSANQGKLKDLCGTDADNCECALKQRHPCFSC
jgi:NAD(P)-dependent dehydrogenase (short-subunit alcohol dehydrogenase family)